MNDPADQATVAAPTSPPTGAEPTVPTGVPPSTRRVERSKPQGSRQARVVVRKLGPWSVLKLSFLFYLCVMAVFLGAMVNFVLSEGLEFRDYVVAYTNASVIINESFVDAEFGEELLDVVNRAVAELA